MKDLRCWYWLALGLLLPLGACREDPDCEDDFTNPALPAHVFRKAATGEWQPFAPDTLWVFGFEREEALIRTVEDSTLQIRLSPRQDSVRLRVVTVVDSLDRRTDTLVLGFQREPSFHSRDCGFIQTFSGIEVQAHTFPRIELPKNRVDQDQEGRLELYFER